MKINKQAKNKKQCSGDVYCANWLVSRITSHNQRYADKLAANE
jgi:hypothetical protein